MRVPAGSVFCSSATRARMASLTAVVLYPLRLHDVDPDRLRAVVQRRRRRLGGTGLDIGDLAEPDRADRRVARRRAARNPPGARAALRDESCCSIEVPSTPADRRREVLRAQRGDDLIDADARGASAPGRTSTLSCALSPPTTFTCATPGIARSSPPICWSASCVSCGVVSVVDVSASETIGSVVRVEPLDDRLDDLLRQLRRGPRRWRRGRPASPDRRSFENDELDDDLREAVGRRRVDLVDAADAESLSSSRVDDLALDDVGRRAGIARCR